MVTFLVNRLTNLEVPTKESHLASDNKIFKIRISGDLRVSTNKDLPLVEIKADPATSTPMETIQARAPVVHLASTVWQVLQQAQVVECRALLQVALKVSAGNKVGPSPHSTNPLPIDSSSVGGLVLQEVDANSLMAAVWTDITLSRAWPIQMLPMVTSTEAVAQVWIVARLRWAELCREDLTAAHQINSCGKAQSVVASVPLSRTLDVHSAPTLGAAIQLALVRSKLSLRSMRQISKTSASWTW